MTNERLQKDLETTMNVVRKIAGHPDVSIEEASEILALTGQRLEALNTIRGLGEFSSADIKTAQEFIGSLKPPQDSSVRGFRTVQKILEFQQQLTTFSEADEKLIQKALRNTGIQYQEPDSIKAGRLLLALGYLVGDEGRKYDHIQDQYFIGVIKPRYPEIGRGWFGLKTQIKHPSLLLGFLRFKELHYNVKGWLFEVYGRENIPEAISISKRLREQFDKEIQINLKSENAHFTSWRLSKK